MIITLSAPFVHSADGSLWIAPGTSGVGVFVGTSWGQTCLWLGVDLVASAAARHLTSHEDIVTWASEQGVQIIVAPQEPEND